MSELPDLEAIRARLRPYKLRIVAQEIGVNPHTLYRFMNENSRPPYDTVKKLVDWMNSHE